jgi:hypothetical protein
LRQAKKQKAALCCELCEFILNKTSFLQKQTSAGVIFKNENRLQIILISVRSGQPVPAKGIVTRVKQQKRLPERSVKRQDSPAILINWVTLITGTILKKII